MTHHKLFALPLCFALLAGCAAATSERYPSLAVREVERAEGSFEPVETRQLEVPEVTVDLPGGLEVQLAALLEQVQAAHTGFVAAVPAAERQVRAASGSDIGSDSWAAAQVALADLDSARSNSAIALGELDILYAAASVQAQDTTAIVATRDAVIALVGEEDEILERLRSQVR